MAITSQDLSRLPFLSSLSSGTLQDLADRVYERRLSSGELIALQGEPCHGVYFVARGLVRVRRLSAEGREQVLAYVGTGEPLNLVPALDGQPSLATVDAIMDSILYGVACDHFERVMHRHQDLTQAVLDRLAADVRRLSDMVEDLALYTVRARLARFLLEHVENRSPARHWTQEEIAASIGTVREMVGRTLRSFATDGLIRRERGRVVVVDQEGLQREAVSR